MGFSTPPYKQGSGWSKQPVCQCCFMRSQALARARSVLWGLRACERAAATPTLSIRPFAAAACSSQPAGGVATTSSSSHPFAPAMAALPMLAAVDEGSWHTPVDAALQVL